MTNRPLVANQRAASKKKQAKQNKTKVRYPSKLSLDSKLESRESNDFEI